jgi:hypothetical protein
MQKYLCVYIVVVSDVLGIVTNNLNPRFHSHNYVVIRSVSYICCDEKWLEVISFRVAVVSSVLYFESEGMICCSLISFWVAVVSSVLYFESQGMIEGICCSFMSCPKVFHVVWSMCHKNLGYGSQVAHHFTLYCPLADLIPIKECHLAQYQTFLVKTVFHHGC